MGSGSSMDNSNHSALHNFHRETSAAGSDTSAGMFQIPGQKYEANLCNHDSVS